jgi:hypothetical protein
MSDYPPDDRFNDPDMLPAEIRVGPQGGSYTPPRRANPLNPFSGNGSLTAQPAQVGGTLASVEQQRALGELQAQIMLAKMYPRDPRRATEALLNDCTRVELAQDATYAFPRGNQTVSGPSIRLLEAAARRWGNLQSGIAELSRDRDLGVSECVAYAWDVETGYRDERKFQVYHLRDRSAGRGGQQRLTDEREVYELVANMGQRRKRACLEAVIPTEVIDAAVAQCVETLQQKDDVTLEGRKKLLAAFAQYGVTQAHIEHRLGLKFEAIRPAQVVQLRRIFSWLKDGMGGPAEFFPGWQPPGPPTRQTASDAPKEPPSEPVAPPKSTPPVDTQPEPSTDQEPPEGEDGVRPFEAMVLGEDGEPMDGIFHSDPLVFAQEFLKAWQASQNRATLVEQNRDGIEDACAADPQADALLDGVREPELPPPVTEDKDTRLANSMCAHIKRLTSDKDIIAYMDSAAVKVPLARWHRESRAELMTAVRDAVNKRLAQVRGG